MSSAVFISNAAATAARAEVTRLVIYGNGAIAEACHLELSEDTRFEVCAFTVDRHCRDSETLMDCPLVDFEQVAKEFPPDEYAMLIAVGYVRVNKLRAERFGRAKELGYTLISYVSPRAITWPGLQLGENTVIAAGAIVNPTAKIGNDVFVGAGCIIPHDVEIDDHCFFSDGVVLAGSVRVGECCYLGPNATVRNKVTLSRETVVGAGAVILTDTAEREVYMAAAAERLPITSDRLTLG